MNKSTLPPNVYLQTDLEQSGIGFDVNVVDTVIERGMSMSFYTVVLLFLVLLFALLTGQRELFPGNYLYLLLSLCGAYVIVYAGRLWYFSAVKRRILNDPPIAVEAYGTVLLDKGPFGRSVTPRRSAVLFRESGTLKPRYFTGVVQLGTEAEFRSGQLAQVFIDRRRPMLYSVDDGHGFEAQRNPLTWLERLGSFMPGRTGTAGFNTKAGNTPQTSTELSAKSDSASS